MNDLDEICTVLSRMRETMLKAHPEWLAECVGDPLECVLNLENYQKELEEKCLGLSSDLIGQEHRLGSEIEKLQRFAKNDADVIEALTNAVNDRTLENAKLKQEVQYYFVQLNHLRIENE